MSIYMVVKVLKDGRQKAEFFNDKQALEAFLLFLRGIEQEYSVCVWTGNAYQLTRTFTP